MIKVLGYMNLNYKYLYKNDEISRGLRKVLYKEDTNVLCYYVIKTILLFFYDEFFEWCMLHNNNILKFNKTEHNLTQFYEFIKDKYNNKFFLKAIHNMELFYIKYRGPTLIKNNKILTTTSRMTICEN